MNQQASEIRLDHKGISLKIDGIISSYDIRFKVSEEYHVKKWRASDGKEY